MTMSSLLSRLKHMYHHLPEIPEEWSLSLLMTVLAGEKYHIYMLQTPEQYEEALFSWLVVLLESLLDWQYVYHICTATTPIGVIHQLFDSIKKKEKEEESLLTNNTTTRNRSCVSQDEASIYSARESHSLSSTSSFISAMSYQLGEGELPSTSTLINRGEGRASCLILRHLDKLSDITQLFITEVSDTTNYNSPPPPYQ
jgi:hypothetical protein